MVVHVIIFVLIGGYVYCHIELFSQNIIEFGLIVLLNWDIFYI
jgi:hypothetical protein